MSCPINTYKNNTYNEVDIEIINGYHNAVVDDLLSYDNLFQLNGNKLSVKETKFQLPTYDGIVASELAIRDLAARMSDRIGIPVRFESDRTKEYKGKIENNVAYINLAYATLDTPIHEILGHPIVRAIKQGAAVSGEYVETYTTTENGKEKGFIQGYYDKNSYSVKNLKTGEVKLFDNFDDAKTFQNDAMFFGKNTQLYQNLLKELETGRGKEVLDRIKRDYVYKNAIDFDTTEINDGEPTSTKEYSKVLDYAKKEGFFNEDPFSIGDFTQEKIFSIEGETYKTTVYKDGSSSISKLPKYTLEEQQEEAIVELLGLMTAEKLDNVKDGKLISLLKRLLKEMKAFMKQLLGQKEVEIDKLPDNMTLGDIADLLAYSNSKLILPGNEVIYTTPDNQQFKTYQEASNHISELARSVEDVDLSYIDLPIINKAITNINDIPVNEFYSDMGNLIKKEDNKWVEFTEGDDWVLNDKQVLLEYNNVNELAKDLSDRTGINSFLEKNKEYEQSKEIIEEWKKVNNIQYNPEEVYSRGQEFISVVGAYSNFDVNLMMQNLLQHIEDNQKAGGEFTISAFTKPIDRKIGHLEGGGGKIKFKIYPQSKDIKWAANTDVYSGSVWDASEKVSKDEKSELLGVSYTKYPSLQNVNEVQPNLAAIIDDLAHHHNELGISLTGSNFRLEYDEDIPYSTKKIIDSINSILDQKYGKLVKPDLSKKILKSEKIYEVRWKNSGGVIIRTTDLNKAKAEMQGDYTDAEGNKLKPEDVVEIVEGSPIEQIGIQPTQTKETLKESISDVKETMDIFFKDKEYTSQALINTKIVKLKEVTKKYPRSLIRSEVKRKREYNDFGQDITPTDPDDLPFQRIPSNVKSAIAAMQSINYKYGANVVTIKDSGELQVDVSIIEDQILPDNSIYYSKELNSVRTITENLNSFEFKLDLLKKSLPGVEIVFDSTINGKGKVESKNGKIKLSINTDSWTSDTLIHEFGHLYIDILLNDGYTNLIDNGINQLKGTKLWNDIAARYSTLDENTLGKEVLATAIGLEGAGLAVSLENPNIFNKISSVIESILNAIRRLLGLDQNVARQLANQLLSNQALSNNLDGIVLSFQEYYSKRSQEEVRDQIVQHQKDVIKNDETHEYFFEIAKPDGVTSIKAVESMTQYVKAGKDADFAEKAIDAARVNLGIKYGEPVTQEQLQAIDNLAYELQESWTTGSTLGTNIHALFEDLLSKDSVKSDISEYFVANYIMNRETGKSAFANLSEEERKQHSDNFTKLVTVLRNIKSKHPGGIFLTEVKLFDILSDHPRAGTADLIVINTDGTASIYDFKTSINPVYEIRDKQQVLTSSYMNYMFEKHAKQLYGYAAILKKNFNINTVDFNIIPIHLDIESNDRYKAIVSTVGPQKMIEINSFAISKSIREGVNLEFKVQPTFTLSDTEALTKVSNYIKKQIDTTNTFIESVLGNRTANVNLAEIRKIANDLETYQGLDAVVVNIRHLQQLYEKTREHYVGLLQAYFAASNKTGMHIQMRVEDKLQLMSIVNYIQAVTNATTDMLDLTKLLSIPKSEIDIQKEVLDPLNALIGQTTVFKGLINEEILDGLAHRLAKETKIGKHEYRQKYEKEFQDLNKTVTFGGLIQDYYIGTEKVDKQTWIAARTDYVASKFKDNAQEIYNNSLKAAKAYVKKVPFDIQIEHKFVEAGEFNNEIIKYIYNSLKDADINKQQAYIAKRNELVKELAGALTPEQNSFLSQFNNPGKIFNKFINGDHLVTKYKDDFLYGDGGFYDMRHNASIINKQIKKALADNKLADAERLKTQLEQYQKAWFVENTIKGVNSNGKIITVPALKWLNPQYSSIMSNAKDAELYNILLKLVVDSDVLVNNSSLRLTTSAFNTEFIRLPSFSKSKYEALTESGKQISNTWERVKQYWSKDVSDTDFALNGGMNPSDDLDFLQKMQDINAEVIVKTDVNGKTIPNINFPYRGLLGNDRQEHTNNISHDLVASLLANYEVSYNYYEKSKMKDDILLIMSALEDKNLSITTKRGNSNSPTVFDQVKGIFGFNRGVKKSTVYIDEATGNLVKADENTPTALITLDEQQDNRETRWFSALNSVVQQRLLGIKLTGSAWSHNLANTTNTIAAAHTLMFNIPSAIANYSQGIYATFMESGITTVLDKKAVTRAIGISLRENIVELYDTINSPIPTTKNGALLDRFNARDTSSSPDSHILQKSMLFRTSISSISQITDKVVNANLSNINMNSILLSIKLKNSDGNYIDNTGKVTNDINKATTYYDAVTYKDGNLLFPDYYLSTGEAIASIEATKIIQKRISEVNFKTQGYYQKDGVIEHKRNAFGKLLFSMKSWLPSFINRRLRLVTNGLQGNLEQLRDLGRINYNDDLQTEDVGTFTERINFTRTSLSSNWAKHDNETAILRILNTVFDSVFKNTENFNNLSYDAQRRVIVSNRTNVYITLTGLMISLIHSMLFVELDDDEKEEFIANILNSKKKIIKDLKELRVGKTGEYLEAINESIDEHEQQLKDGISPEVLKKYYFNSAVPSVIGKSNPDKYEKIDGKWYNRQIELKYSELEIMGIKPFPNVEGNLLSINNEREYWKYIFGLSFIAERIHDEASQLTPESIPSMIMFNSGGPSPQKLLTSPITAVGLVKDSEVFVKNVLGMFDTEANDVYLTNKKSSEFPGTYENISYTPKDKLLKSIFKHWGMEDYQQMYKTIYGKDKLGQD